MIQAFAARRFPFHPALAQKANFSTSSLALRCKKKKTRTPTKGTESRRGLSCPDPSALIRMRDVRKAD